MPKRNTKTKTKTTKAKSKSKFITTIGIDFAGLSDHELKVLNDNLIIVDGELIRGTGTYQPEGHFNLAFYDDEDSVVIQALAKVAKDQGGGLKLDPITLIQYGKNGRKVREYRYPEPKAIKIGSQAYSNREKKHGQPYIAVEVTFVDWELSVPTEAKVR